MEWCRRHWNYEQWNYGVLFQLSSECIILDYLSECCHKILCGNSSLDTAKYRDTTLENILKFSIECVSTNVSYEYRHVNGINPLTINSVRGDQMIHVSWYALCETALSVCYRLYDERCRWSVGCLLDINPIFISARRLKTDIDKYNNWIDSLTRDQMIYTRILSLAKLF